MLPLPMFPDPTAPPPLRPGMAPLIRAGPARVLAELLAGNRRVVAGLPRYGYRRDSAASAHADRDPFALVVGCLDARVPVEAIFDQDFGAICAIRSGGHVLDRAMIGSVEFAVLDLGVPLVVVLGHQRCAAVAATVDAVRTGRRPLDERSYLIDEITPAVREAAPGGEALARATRARIRRTVHRLQATTRLAAATGAGRLDIVGALYDLDTGHVETL